MSSSPQLFNFDVAVFLRDYWQQKPLLIKNPWDQWANPLDPDELAGLACEETVESRLITLQADQIGLEEGPLPPDRFEKLGKTPWTLLVQAVDHHIPAVAALLEPFRFIPDWRIDDVMVSYAVDGGGVGAHFDQYDVFLVQGLGQRRWQIGQLCDGSTQMQDHDDLRLLADFCAVEEWVLDPGDILYVPPRYAHHGVAVGDDCMTYSIGFRAPSQQELIGDWADEMLGQLDDDDRYEDPGLQMQENSGEITADALAKLQSMMAQKLLDRDNFARWFGQFNSAPKDDTIDWRPDETLEPADVRQLLAAQTSMFRNSAGRFVFIRKAETVALFVDGDCYECSGEAASFAQSLCAHNRLIISPRQAGSDDVVDLITHLLNQGSIAFDS